LLAQSFIDKAPSDWIEWLNDIPNETLSFDEAWILLNIT
jgi:hypothetical protein